MRGGAIPFLVWGTLLAVLLTINWIWEGTGLHVALFGFAVLVIYGAAAGLAAVRGRIALRKGEPEYSPEPEPLPRISLAAGAIGVSLGVMVFGIAFGPFLILIGGGLLLASVARLIAELSWQRRTVRAVRREPRP